MALSAPVGRGDDDDQRLDPEHLKDATDIGGSIPPPTVDLSGSLPPVPDEDWSEDIESSIDSMIAEFPEQEAFEDPLPVEVSALSEEDPHLGKVLAGKYVIQRLIAKGGMGRVYLGTQLPLGRRVAVKCLIPQPLDHEFRRRFFLEASTCAKLVHRHIVTVHDYGEAEGGELFMAMEYLDGEPLNRVIAREGQLSGERTMAIALQICRALRAAHKAGVVHRDLKPANVMLIRDEDHDRTEFVKVLDFGLVKPLMPADAEYVTGDLTRSGTWLGSPRYMSPEQIRCTAIDGRSDIYSLGAILFHMVAGRPPFTGATSVEILGQHLRDPVPWIASLGGNLAVAPELEVIIRRCLEKRPEDRPQSMDEVMAELEAASRLSAVSVPAPPLQPVVPQQKDRPALLSATGEFRSPFARDKKKQLEAIALELSKSGLDLTPVARPAPVAPPPVLEAPSLPAAALVEPITSRTDSGVRQSLEPAPQLEESRGLIYAVIGLVVLAALLIFWGTRDREVEAPPPALAPAIAPPQAAEPPPPPPSPEIQKLAPAPQKPAKKTAPPKVETPAEESEPVKIEFDQAL